VILRNARIGQSFVDLRIERGMLVEVGTPDRKNDRKNEQVVDLDGRWISPGLWDNHVHFTQWALQSRRLDVSAATSAEETARLIAAAMAGVATSARASAGASAGADPNSSAPFIAVGFRDGLWPDKPTLAVLDAVSTGPIVVVSADLHAVWLNSAALRRYAHGDHSRSETGLLREGEAFRVLGLIDVVDVTLLDEWVDAAARAAAARGIVGIVDYEMAWNHDSWARRQAAGNDSLRVEIGVYTQHLERAIDEGLRTGVRLGELLTMGNFKILIDGSLNTRTAYCWDEYASAPSGGETGEYGILTVQPDRLEQLMARAFDAGIHPAVHAIGDRANTIALDAFEAVGCHGRIEHAQFVSDSDLARFGRLGVAASVQPDHAMDDRDVAERYWSGRTDRAFPLRSLLSAGATVLLGSDAPVSPLDPWRTIAAAVGRSRDGREPWHPEQSITAAEAIVASSRSTIAVGQPADLVVTDNDPLGSTPDELRDMSVYATLLGGRFTHGG
jgi:predicted amidohydrolase YtcJ